MICLQKAQLGWNYLRYKDAWPEVVAGDEKSSGVPEKKPSSWARCTTAMCM